MKPLSVHNQRGCTRQSSVGRLIVRANFWWNGVLWAPAWAKIRPGSRSRAPKIEASVRDGVRIEQARSTRWFRGVVGLWVAATWMVQAGCLTHKSCNCDPDREYCVRYTSDDIGERYSFECRDLPDECLFPDCLCIEEHDEKASSCAAESGSYCEETAASYVRFTCWEDDHRQVLRRRSQYREH